jgi:hypothetical protein
VLLLRRTKDEALDLPPKVWTWQPVDTNDKQVVVLEGGRIHGLTVGAMRDKGHGKPTPREQALYPAATRCRAAAQAHRATRDKRL